MKRPYKKKKSLTLSKVYRPWEDFDVEDAVVGKVIGTHMDQYDKKCLVVEVEEAIFADKEEAKKVTGKNLVLNNCGQLDKQMKAGELPVDTIVEVIYKGKAKMEKGKYSGKDAHVLEINILSEDDGSEEGGEEEQEPEL